jgi:hypothetical protein
MDFDPKLGRWIWKGWCPRCGTMFGGHEHEHTDPMKNHPENCPGDPDDNDRCEIGRQDND